MTDPNTLPNPSDPRHAVAWSRRRPSAPLKCGGKEVQVGLKSPNSAPACVAIRARPKAACAFAEGRRVR